jgi:Na+/proline symporter
MGGLSKLDLAVVVAYLAGTTAFGLYVSRRVKDTEGFFMGNRRFGKSLMVAQALTTGTRADFAIGVVGASYEIRMAGAWYQLRLTRTFSIRRYRLDEDSRGVIMQ